MLKLSSAALCAALVSLPLIANAQTACAPRQQVVSELQAQYGERQVLLGLAADGHVMELFASPAMEWTLVATRPDGLSCIVVAGSHLSFVSSPPVSKPADPA